MNQDQLLPPTLPCPHPELDGLTPARHFAELMDTTAPGIRPYFRCSYHGLVYGPVNPTKEDATT